MNNTELEELKKKAARWDAYRKHPDWRDIATLLPLPPEHIDFAMDAFIRDVMPKP